MEDKIYTYCGNRYDTYNYHTRINKATEELNKKNEVLWKWINRKFKYSHTAHIKGYISRKCQGEIHNYNGKYGKGIVLIHPCYYSTRYCLIDYYIER